MTIGTSRGESLETHIREHSQRAKLLPTHPETVKIMRENILKLDGDMRFDEYMTTSLFGKGGFYRDRTSIDSDFYTHAQNPLFAELIHQYLINENLDDKDFVEIAGGAAHFKKNYLQSSNKSNRLYLSIDSSPALASFQKHTGKSNSQDHTIVADAISLPFRDSAFNGTIFANELLDALPCRVFKIKVENDICNIDSEAYVVANRLQTNLDVCFKPVIKDRFVREYESFLTSVQSERDLKDGSILSVSPHFAPLMQELNRVLGNGKILLFDYGFNEYVTNSNSLHFKPAHSMIPYNASSLQSAKDKLEKSGKKNTHNHASSLDIFTDAPLLGIREVISRPYETDITFYVDFSFLHHLSKANGANVRCRSQDHFFRTILERSPSISKKFSQSTIEGLLADDKEFILLEITK